MAILDADKEGLLRSETSLIQTIGRASRNAQGKVIMYADTVTDSMRRAIEETNRRRKIQQAYNEAHGITPQTVMKAVRDLIEIGRKEAEKSKLPTVPQGKLEKEEKEKLIASLTAEMKEAARQLEFERAAYLRDRIAKLKG